MSKTDKTRPYWVQLRDPRLGLPLRTHHNVWFHARHDGPCDPDFPTPVTRRPSFMWYLRQGDPSWPHCEVWTCYRDNDKIFGRSRWRRNYPSMDGKARASLRKLRADWLKTAPEDREDIDSRTDVPRSKWLWRSWYWD